MANEPRSGPTWHVLSVEDVGRRLNCDLAAGLSSEEAARRLAANGPNVIRETARRGLAAMLVAQLADFMILLLLGAAGIAALVGDAKDTIVILVIVLLNAAIGFAQEFRAERAVAALKRMGAPAAVVVREGRRHVVAAETVVPGDIVLLEAGGAVPADLRLIETASLRLGESALTGESTPVDKRTDPLTDPDLGMGDRVNMALKGAVALHGRGRGIAVATGMASELGRIAGMLSAAPEMRTPLQHRLAAFGRHLSVIVLAICVVVFAVGLLRGEPVLLMFLTALSLAVAAVPEALPAVVTVLLALGARKMARRNALIRRLPAVETLGSVTYICSDKTGTLTMNEMRATDAAIAGERMPASALRLDSEPQRRLLEALALCNDAARERRGNVIGDPTETAVWRLSAEAGLERSALERSFPRVAELPFDSDRKRMTTLHRDNGGVIAYTKGAPEALLSRCIAMLTETGEVDPPRERLGAIVEAMAADGLRILAVAYRRWDALPRGVDADEVERDLVLLGFVGLRDPPRPEAKAAVASCHTAGIVPVMITGDHPRTARAIARTLGIIAERDPVLTGQELKKLPDAELDARIAEFRVFARVEPAQKIRIVEALQSRGEFVAMTGDGVNDAPALARADIGVAMGKIGTDVAREAASLVLLDDNFATIVSAVREGRRIYDNIRKFVRYVLTCNSAEVWTVFLAPFLGLPVPLLPIQILWINLVTDGLPGLALAAEPPERDVMERPPRPPKESVFADGTWQHMIWVGLLMAGMSLLVQAYAVNAGSEHWRTMVFTVLTLSQMGQVLAIRSERDSLFTIGVLGNRPLLGAVSLTIALQLLVVYLPPLNPIFDTAPLGTSELAICLAASSAVFVAVETEKWLKRHRRVRIGRRLPATK